MTLDVGGVMVSIHMAFEKYPLVCSGVCLGRGWVLTSGNILGYVAKHYSENNNDTSWIRLLDSIDNGNFIKTDKKTLNTVVRFSVTTCRQSTNKVFESKTLPDDDQLKGIKTKCEVPQKKARYSSAEVTSLDPFVEFKADLKFIWKCLAVAEVLNTVFSDWVLGSTSSAETNMNTNDTDIEKKLLPLFLILKLHTSDRSSEKNEYDDLLATLFSVVAFEQEVYARGQSVMVESTPFGKHSFCNSFSEGIICNIVGSKKSVILTDARTAIGSEGGPIYALCRRGDVTTRRLIGIVICSLSWYHGEWVGFTLGAALSSVFQQLLMGQSSPIANTSIVPPKLPVDHLACIDDCIVLVRRGYEWGSGVVVDSTDGIILTNAHVVQKAKDNKVQIHWKNRSFVADVIFRTRSDLPYDVAVLRVGPHTGFRSAVLSSEAAVRGEPVIAAGFPLLCEHHVVLPTVTRGIVAHVSDPVAMLQTTCCVQSGASGGAVFRLSGQVIGLISCNIQDKTSGGLHPRVNMVVPASAIAAPLYRFLRTCDVRDLCEMESKDPKVQRLWRLQTVISKI